MQNMHSPPCWWSRPGDTASDSDGHDQAWACCLACEGHGPAVPGTPPAPVAPTSELAGSLCGCFEVSLSPSELQVQVDPGQQGPIGGFKDLPAWVSQGGPRLGPGSESPNRSGPIRLGVASDSHSSLTHISSDPSTCRHWAMLSTVAISCTLHFKFRLPVTGWALSR